MDKTQNKPNEMSVIIGKLMKDNLRELQKYVNQVVKETIALGKNERDCEINDYVEHTKERLKAYPDLIERIEKNRLDIEDIKKESKFIGNSKSKDIVMMPSGGGGEGYTKEEILQAKIMIREKKIRIDQEEIDEINWALSKIQGDEYYMAIEYKYFEKLTDDEIAEKMFCDKTTVWRNIGRLIRQLKIYLYGVNAVHQRRNSVR